LITLNAIMQTTDPSLKPITVEEYAAQILIRHLKAASSVILPELLPKILIWTVFMRSSEAAVSGGKVVVQNASVAYDGLTVLKDCLN